MTQTQLLPCPFCGGEACVEEVARHKWIAICADKYRCGTEGWFEDTRDEAIAAWNRRAESADLAALRQRVQELDEIRDAIGLCAAAVVLAYYRKTHDHILVDNDAIDAALKVEHWLGRR